MLDLRQNVMAFASFTFVRYSKTDITTDQISGWLVAVQAELNEAGKSRLMKKIISTQLTAKSLTFILSPHVIFHSQIYCRLVMMRLDHWLGWDVSP